MWMARAMTTKPARALPPPFTVSKRAASLTAPGDTELVGDGIYTDTAGADAVLKITKSVRPDAWITWYAGVATILLSQGHRTPSRQTRPRRLGERQAVGYQL